MKVVRVVDEIGNNLVRFRQDGIKVSMYDNVNILIKL